MNTTEKVSACCDKDVIHEEAVKRAIESQEERKVIEDTAALFKAMGDPTRLSIVTLLKKGELCVCDIAYALNMTQSAISHQLKVLTGIHITKKRKEGKVVYYSIHDSHVEQIVHQAISHIVNG
ncbi:MAG: ArsR/SmtB family transcription factor [Bacilli bacterium]